MTTTCCAAARPTLVTAATAASISAVSSRRPAARRAEALRVTRSTASCLVAISLGPLVLLHCWQTSSIIPDRLLRGLRVERLGRRRGAEGAQAQLQHEAVVRGGVPA